MHQLSEKFPLRGGRPVSQEEIEKAVQTILSWIGDDPSREGLRETPARVAQAFKSYFSGYGQEPEAFLEKTFEETAGYDEMVLLRKIPFQSHCEHHMAPINGHAWVGYVPRERVVGISKLARVVEAYANRLQIQERLTAEIAGAIDRVLEPRGVAVLIKASHQCISGRGVKKPGVDLVTTQMLGCFRSEADRRQEFLAIVSADGPD
ncbi:MAG TPA: GTP cyclohydrolase I FolE [Bradyrhizobium sp.]|nr:GTP cyclohydrolase I FolE [Bradyrhizobium sp.]HET7888788.1 GTP cyclohydrolase I FolE [Bradyrhizobium sp.]